MQQSDKTCSAISIEAFDCHAKLSKHDTLVLGYPIYFSNAPKIMQDFIVENKECFAYKKVFIIATMGLFSGDGAGCAARLLRKCGAEIIGGLHLKMPDCIGDEKMLKKSDEANRQIISRADDKITKAVHRLNTGNPNKEGLNFLCHLTGLLGQRLWFYGKTTSYKKKPDIDTQKCVGCGRCTEQCPMKNITLENKKAVSHNRCTLCYRCFSHCPTQALTILGKRVHEQWLFENY